MRSHGSFFVNSLLLRVNLVKIRKASLVTSCQGLPLTFRVTLCAGTEDYLECVGVLPTFRWSLRKRKMRLRELCQPGSLLSQPQAPPGFAGGEQGCGANPAKPTQASVVRARAVGGLEGGEKEEETLSQKSGSTCSWGDESGGAAAESLAPQS